MDSDPIGAIVRRLAWVLVGAAVIDAADEQVTGLGRRHPRALRFARLVGGALLALAGLYEAALTVVVWVYVAITGDRDDILATPVLLLPLAFGVGLTIWGLRMMRRGWASRGVVDATLTGSDDSFRESRPEGRPEGHDIGAATAGWLRTVLFFVLWIAGSVIAILAGVPDGYAMLLGCLLPVTAYLVYRRRRAAGRY